MTEFQIRWDPDPPDRETLRAWGRNGMIRCAGIQIQAFPGRVLLRAITGRGHPARGLSIEAPDDPETLRDIGGALMVIASAIQGRRRRQQTAAGVNGTPAVSPGARP